MLVHPILFAADSSASGIGALGVDLKAFIIQLITFILGYLVLRKWAFDPVMKIMNQRRQTIENGVKLGEQMQKEQAELEQKVAQELRDARVQADAVVADAQAQARLVVQDAEDQASKKADSIVAAAHDRIAQDTARARKQLEAEVVSLVSDATEAIIGEKVDAKKDAALIDKALKEQRAA